MPLGKHTLEYGGKGKGDINHTHPLATGKLRGEGA